MTISSDEYETWLANPVTKWFLGAVKLNADGVREQFHQLYFLSTPTVEAVPLMNQIRGEWFACETISNLRHEDIVTIYEQRDVNDEAILAAQAAN